LTYAQLRSAIGEFIGQERRVEHCIRVARFADRLAIRHGADARKARLSGMLHDLARLWSRERLLDEAQQRGLRIDPFEERHPIVLHARLGAELARERFGVDDEDVLDAIRLHTLGAPEMALLTEIVYLADALEPGRSYPDRAALERLAFENVREAVAAVLQSTIALMEARGDEVAPQTRAAFERYASVHA
jgi:predicted HD superfamily hydrolase involved in NAD metabolism